MCDLVLDIMGDSISVDAGKPIGTYLGDGLNDVVSHSILGLITPEHSNRLFTQGIQPVKITLKYKHLLADAALGFFRSSVHQDPSLFTSVMDYLAVEKGWFNPYLFASGRRPIIPRSVRRHSDVSTVFAQMTS